ncbi:hypothetical protein ACFVOR_16635 [Streptomyces sp. NPDC057837]|uniref:hypothetical protein n=1 Tax=Streptomyces sp. NPDC057837 TaxID=3346260 RepID=UPI0036CBC8A4
MEQHRGLINGQWIRTQRILYGSDAALAAAGIRTRDTVDMDWYRIPDVDSAQDMRWVGKVVRRSENCTIRLIVRWDDGFEPQGRTARQSVLNASRDSGVCGRP